MSKDKIDVEKLSDELIDWNKYASVNGWLTKRELFNKLNNNGANLKEDSTISIEKDKNE